MTQKTIKVDVKNKASIEQALVEFRADIQSAYKTGQVINLVPAFVPTNKNLFENSDLLKIDDIKEYYRFLNPNDPSLEQMENLSRLTFEQLNRQDFYTNYSHIVVFQHALENGLEKLVIDFCKELVEYSIKVDSSNELFFSSDAYFGISILVVLALKNPSYLYLTGEFIARSSDYNQIKYHVSGHVLFLFNKYGFSNDIIKMFAYNKFNELYYCFSEYDGAEINLFKALLEDKEKYNLYKKYLLESFIKYPQEINADYEDDRTFVYDIIEKLTEIYDNIIELDAYDNHGESYKDLNLDFVKDDFDNFKIHGNRLEDEITEIHNAIFEAIKDIPRNQYYFQKIGSYGDETLSQVTSDPFFAEYETYLDHEINNSFYLDGFENGAQILNYIETGEQAEIIDELEKVNIRKLAYQKKLKLYKRLEYYGSGDMKLSKDLNQDVTLVDILDGFTAAYLNADSYDLEDQDEYRNKQKAIRVLEVLIKLTGTKQITPDEIELICENLELMSEDDLVEKFSIGQLSDNEIMQRMLLELNSSFTNNIGLIKLRSVHRLYKKNPDIFTKLLDSLIQQSIHAHDPDILAVSPELQQQKYARGAQLICIAYIIYAEMQDLSNLNCPHLRRVIEFYQENIFTTLKWRIKESSRRIQHSKKNKQEISDVVNSIFEYVEGPKPKAPPREIIEKLMKGGMDSLNEEEKKIMQSFKPGKSASAPSEEDMLKVVDDLLLFEDDELNDTLEELKNRKNIIFQSDSATLAITSLLYVAKVAPTPFQKQLLRMFNLILKTAPVKTLYGAFKDFRNDYYSREIEFEEFNSFEDLLIDLKIDQKYIIAFKIFICQKQFQHSRRREIEEGNFLKDIYNTLLNEYSYADEVDEDESPLFAAREKARKQATKDSIFYLDIENRQIFLKRANDIKSCKEYSRLCVYHIKDILLKYFARKIDGEKSIWQMNQEEKLARRAEAQECTEYFYQYLDDKLSVEELDKLALSKLYDFSHFEYYEVINSVYHFNFNYFKRLLYLTAYKKDYPYFQEFYDYIRYYTDDVDREDSIYKFHDIAIESGIKPETMYEYYLNEHRQKLGNSNYENNPFAQILVRKYDDLQNYEHIKKLKAYKVFDKYVEKYKEIEL